MTVALTENTRRQHFTTGDHDTLTWASNKSRSLVDAARAEAEAGVDFVWFAGEASDMREVRRLLRHELGWPPSRYHTMGYWRRDAEEWARRKNTLSPAASKELALIYASDTDDETMRDQADAILIQHGL